MIGLPGDWRVRYALMAFVGASIFSAFLVMFANDIQSYSVMTQFVIALFIYFVMSFSASKAIGDGVRTIVGTMFLVMATDLLLPPYIVGLDGVLSNVLLSGISIDMFLASIYSGIGITNLPLWIVVYPVSFAILFVGSLMLLSKREFLGVF